MLHSTFLSSITKESKESEQMERDEYVSRMQKAVEKAAVAISQLKDENFSLKEKLAAA